MSLIKLAAAAVAPSIIFASASSSEFDYNQRLASLLVEGRRPDVAELDNLVRDLFASKDYQRVTKGELIGKSDFVSLLDSVVPPSDESGGDSPVSAIFTSKTPRGANPPMLRVARAGGVPTRSSGALDGIPAISLSDVTVSGSIQYIVTTIDTLSHLVLVINQLDADMKSQNYVDVVKALDADFNLLLAQLANEAIDRLSLSSESSKNWKDALWQLHLLVADYVSQEKGIDEWAAFKAQVAAGLAKLIDYAVVANAIGPAYVPPKEATNEELKQELQNEAIDTSCLCIWKCLYRICSGRSSATTTTALPGVEGDDHGVRSAPSAAQAIQTILFIESSVATLQGLINEIETLNAAGEEGKERIDNFKLRVGLRITNIIKQALLNDALDKIYDKLKGRSVLLLGTMAGVTNSGSWDAVKTNIASTISAIVSDLNESKPAGFI